MAAEDVFARLPSARRYWAIASVHGEVDRLLALQNSLETRIQAGDQVIYLGNLLGRGPSVGATLDAVLLCRRRLLARAGVKAEHIVILRGAQEEMWHKLLQIQFAPNPVEVLKWMGGQGIGATIAAYDSTLEDGIKSAQQGAKALAQWTTTLRDAARRHDGHQALLSNLSHAAYTEDGQLLFVNAGIDTAKPLFQQADMFWWGGRDFEFIDRRYFGAKRVIRGYDHRRRGFVMKTATASLDAGCGFGGPLIAACFDGNGEALEVLEA